MLIQDIIPPAKKIEKIIIKKAQKKYVSFVLIFLLFFQITIGVFAPFKISPPNIITQKAEAVGEGWYSTGGTWDYRKKFTVDHDKVHNTDQINFPILISRIDTDLKDTDNGGHAGQADGGDFLFTSSDGLTKLSHEIEKYDNVTGELIAWVNIPVLSASVDTVVYLYYGDNSVSDQWVTDNSVWDSNYVMVQHMGDDSLIADYTAVDTASETINTTNTKIAQKFNSGANTAISSVDLFMSTGGALTGTVRIETDSSGSPSGTLVDATNSYSASTALSANAVKHVPLTGITALAASTDYWIVFSYSSGAGGTFQGGVTGTANQAQYYNGSWNLSASVENIYFKANAKIADATSYTNDGKIIGATTVTGKIGNAQDFDGLNDYILVAHDDSFDVTNTITIETWMYVEDIPDASSYIINKSQSFCFIVTDTNLHTIISLGGSLWGIQAGYNKNQWVHVAVTYDGQHVNRYVDGGTFSSSKPNFQIDNSGNPLNVGSRYGNENFVNGIIDEIRISNVARSGDWIITEYNNTSSPDTFYTVGVEEYYLYLQIAGASVQETGDSQIITITNRDSRNDNAVVTSYTGDKSITFSGANISPNSNNPTCSDKDGVDINFGSPTVLTFVDGVASCTLKLYTTESVSVNATDGVMSTDIVSYGLDVIVNPILSDMSIQINNNDTYTNSNNVILNLSAVNASQMKFSNDNTTYSSYEDYSDSKAWDITNTAYGGVSNDETKTVYVIYNDAYGNELSSINDSIVYETIFQGVFNIDGMWIYRRAISLSSATTVANYQVEVQLTAANFDYSSLSFPATGADLIFTGSDGATLQDYWIESWVNGGTSTIWVEVAALEESTIYMYYGNDDAISASNGANTFVFFDGFESGVLDGYTFGGTLDWIIATDNKYQGTYSGGSDPAIGGNQDSWMERSFTGPARIDFSDSVSSENYLFSFVTGDFLQFLINDVQQHEISGGVGWTARSYAIDSGIQTLKWRYYKDIIIDTGSDRGWIDDLRVRKYASVEPTATLGAEETEENENFILISPEDNSIISNPNPTFSWNAAFDMGSGLAKYQLYIDNSLDTDNISDSTTSIAPTNSLSCGNHIWYIRSTNNAGNYIDSPVFSLTMACASGLSPSAPNPPVPPGPGPENQERRFGVSINNNNEHTNNKTVTLKFTAGADTERMAISNTPDFEHASQISYQEEIEWDLTNGRDEAVSILYDGEYSVYAKFYTQYGVASEVVSDSIILKTAVTDIGEYPDDFDQNQPISETGETKPSLIAFTETLKSGSNNNQVIQLQNKLKELNFFPKEIVSSDNFGLATEQAVVEYQESKDIYPCGIVGPRTRKALNNEEFITNKDYKFTQDLKHNDKNEEVEQLQTRLRDQNFFPYNVSSTGWFGPITQNSVNIFKKFHSLVPDGIVDKLMRDLLNK
ncbi:MAG: DUF2341 domain-containing protein [Candidatus Pacebacteria bacterium]|nr:DUF2341 domain-containing protein [Candidatus Paceibacterota bacterium]